MRALASKWVVAAATCVVLSSPLFPGRHDAAASVSIAVTYDALVTNTTTVGLMTPLEQYSAYEDKRIFTFTRVRVDQAIAGDLGTGAETWVVTRGGVVGNVGQQVDGEAVLHIGEPTLLFLRPDQKSPGLHIVTTRGQGQFIVRPDAAKVSRVLLGNGIGALLPPRPADASERQTSTDAPAVSTQSNTSGTAISKSPEAPTLSSAAKNILLAKDALSGHTLDEVARDVAANWKRLHAAK